MLCYLGKCRMLPLLAALAFTAGMAGCQRTHTTRPPSDKDKAPGGAQRNPGEGAAQRNQESVPRLDLRVKSENRLRQIGLAYQQAAILGPVTGPELLGKDIRLKDPRGRPYEVVWRVDPARAGGDGALLLAWEQAPDEQNGRCVLRVDGSVAHLSEAEFQKAGKARPNR